MGFRNIKSGGKQGEGKENKCFPWETISHFSESLLRAHCVSDTVLALRLAVYLLLSRS